MSVQLHFDTYRTVLTRDADMQFAEAIDIGVDALSRGLLREFPPAELAMEQAIAQVEDALMPHVHALKDWQDATLLLDDPIGVELLHAAGLQAGGATATLELEAVERIFNLLVDVMAGIPARMAGLPETPGFVARLLVLRELMHHAGYARLILPVQPAPAG